MSTRILAAGDHFVLPHLLTDALHREHPDGDLDITDSPCPGRWNRSAGSPRSTKHPAPKTTSSPRYKAWKSASPRWRR